jgi:hypothetical protein
MSEAVDLTYESVVTRVEALDRDQVSIGVLGNVLGYDIKALKVGLKAEG